MNQLDQGGVYAITDPTYYETTDQLLDMVTYAVKGGVGLIQFRLKSKIDQPAYQQVKALATRCEQLQVPLIINDHLEVAQEFGLGIHLGMQDTPILVARKILGDQAIIGATCQDQPSRAQQAVDEGASYLAFGAMFPSQTKPFAPPCSIAVLKKAAARFQLPIVTIGGIHPHNANQLIQAGADWVSVIQSLWHTNETDPELAFIAIEKNARALRNACCCVLKSNNLATIE